MTGTLSRSAAIRLAARTDVARATRMLAAQLTDLFGITATDLRINEDQYSLNSLNGFLTCEHGPCFFKFHQEDDEEAMGGEYYRADILARAGLPVDMPILASTRAGEQMLVYRRRDDPRFSDVLHALDMAPDQGRAARALDAEGRLNDAILAVAQTGLRAITPDQSAAEPIHNLFQRRLTDPVTGAYPGGRMLAFYAGHHFAFPGVDLGWDDLKNLRIARNGTLSRDRLGALFDRAQTRLAPARLADAGGTTAHGDAHNANVWYLRGANRDSLAFFDPAFAGTAIPSLLAEVKSTFHNTLAHPFWLYDSDEIAPRHRVTARVTGDVLDIETDWSPGPLRTGLLEIKARRFWKPWLATLQAQGLLPDDWEEVIRLALFLCPTLVMNLRAGPGGGRHSPQSSAVGFMVAAMAGSPPVSGADDVTRFFDLIRP